MDKIKPKKKMAMGKMRGGGVAKKKMMGGGMSKKPMYMKGGVAKAAKKIKNKNRIMFKWLHQELQHSIYQLMIS